VTILKAADADHQCVAKHLMLEVGITKQRILGWEEMRCQGQRFTCLANMCPIGYLPLPNSPQSSARKKFKDSINLAHDVYRGNRKKKEGKNNNNHR
jgi:hypothetical protein